MFQAKTTICSNKLRNKILQSSREKCAGSGISALRTPRRRYSRECVAGTSPCSVAFAACNRLRVTGTVHQIRVSNRRWCAVVF